MLRKVDVSNLDFVKKKKKIMKTLRRSRTKLLRCKYKNRRRFRRTAAKTPVRVLPVLSVPVMSLNRYCANLKISRLHLFLQLIFAVG